MKKLITIITLVVTLFTISSCSSEGEMFENDLPEKIMEMIDAGWVVQENYAIEPRKDELNDVWAKKSGIDDFHWEYSILFSKEIEGKEKYCIISKFGSYEQAKYYDDETKSAYSEAYTFVIDEFYLTYNKGVTDFKEIFDLN